ncbi:MAG TPA: DUF3048 domain-containing protein [Candidatus Avamphibacillus intestinigallinarum]|nr:DUF3048 domain-containing protein [Candidatus Avamphibacillus intestinigallinarum]
MRKKAISILCASILILLIGCSKDSKPASTDGGKGKGTYPLTGEQTKSGADKRIKAIMVNNHTKARPQSGLSKADIVFEILAEGDITRFLAMYQSEEPDEVGPVRSAREYYFNLADDYNAVYVYHGAAKFVNKMIKDEHIEYINGAQHDNDGTLFKRSTDRQAPHNSYVQFGALEKEMKAAGYDTKADYESLPFKKKDSEVDGEAATNIQVKYSANSDAYNPVYSYQKDQNIYTRSAADEQTVEKSDSTPIEVTNLFVIEAPHEVFDDEGRRKIDLDNGGDAYLFQGGKQKKVKWEKKDGYIIPTEDGKPVGFLPGKTWVNVVPENPGLAQAVEVFNE